jgi:exodeoxyribonuclease VII small subunit
VSPPSTPTEITFADAYDELKEITAKLNNEEIEADELVDLLRRGKGLEAVLREHLSNIEQEVTAIENGDGVTPFRIVRTTNAEGNETDDSADAGGFDPSPPPADNDIPF